MTTTLRLAGGTVHDPANGIDGEIRDLFVRDGIFVAPPADTDDIRTIDVGGLIVMPGGVDMHAHIAGPKVNYARKMRPEDRRREPPMVATDLLRSGTRGSTPSTFATGYLYAGLGYTTVFDAAVPPLGARHAHEEFHDTPIIDKGFFTLIGNNHYALRQIAAGDPARLKDFVAWLLESSRGYALKLVNPGGVEVWKGGGGHDTMLDTKVSPFDVTPRAIIRELAKAGHELGLPHPVHIHCNQLGIPGNWETTLATMQSLEGHRAHLTHIQFHSYGGDPNDQSKFCSQVGPLVDYVNAHPNLSVDVGQVMFGETTSMTGDGPLGHYLYKVTGRKWFNSEAEMEGGCGIVPIVYREKSFVHALQWAIGLEWYLLMRDPWRIAMTTDHPNGGAFISYPEIVALLMSRDYRREVIARLPAKMIGRTTLPDIEREYTLQEIAIITRASPARLLGLTHKGHLGIGADADITVYTPGKDIREMFEMPRMVFKGGELIAERGEFRRVVFGPTLCVAPAYDRECIPHIQDWFDAHYSMSFANYPVSDFYLTHGRRMVACRE